MAWQNKRLLSTDSALHGSEIEQKALEDKIDMIKARKSLVEIFILFMSMI